MKNAKKIIVEHPDDPNVRDPEHAHELGGTLGMTVGGVAGGIAAGVAAATAIGTAVAGPIGAVVGAAIGGGLGGIAGEQIARDVNPTEEERYWSENYRSRPYISSRHSFETYRPAYRLGIEQFQANPNEEFENLEPSLRNNWNINHGNSRLEWDEAREAAQDAFSRLKNRDV